jgi:hypothetical protein
MRGIAALIRELSPQTSRKEDLMNQERTIVGVGSTLGNAGKVVQDGVINSLKDLNKIEDEIINLTKGTISDTIRATSRVSPEGTNFIRDILTGTIQAADGTGTGLIMSVRSVSKGIVIGVNDFGGDVRTAASRKVRIAIEEAVKIGVDIGTVAKDAADGVVEATQQTHGNVEEVAVASVAAALEAAETIGATEVNSLPKQKSTCN